ncbi:hypothetical protein [Flavobacterium sp. T12S277]|uniref:hypothetical protein n=1 Tax=Flavobacterium sp. T12S277 TaxID=3402752 RepID=UPI003AE5C861
MATDGEISHIICVPGISKEQIDELIDAIKADKASTTMTLNPTSVEITDLFIHQSKATHSTNHTLLATFFQIIIILKFQIITYQIPYDCIAIFSSLTFNIYLEIKIEKK